MKRGKHNFQQHAAKANMLEEMGIEVPDGGNVLSIFQKELMALGVRPWQVYARTELIEMGVVFEEDANVLSLYQSIVQKKKMTNGEHPLQQYAADMLEMMGIPVPKGGNVLIIMRQCLIWDCNPCRTCPRSQSPRKTSNND